MGILIIRVQIPQRRRRPSLRMIAEAVATLQVAEAMSIHAERDHCFIHTLMAAGARDQVGQVIPARLMNDADWRHRHIEAPAARLQARVEDQRRA